MQRDLRTNDLPDLVELSTLAGWNQTPSDWEMLLALSPDGCFGIEVQKRIVASATLLCFDRTLAWIGMVLTHPAHRRQGFAHRLVEHLLLLARQRGLAAVKLDASDEGRPVYEAFGFRSERKIERWFRTGSAGEFSTANDSLENDACVLDREVYGYDRAPVLQALALRSKVVVTGNGHLFVRPGREAAYLGPFVAKNDETARRLLAEATSDRENVAWYWDIFPENAAAVALAESLGFAPMRTLMRMALGAEIPEVTKYIYGIAGFEIG